MANKSTWIVIELFLVLFLFTSCNNSNTAGSNTLTFCDELSADYISDILPLITTHCQAGSNCHSAGSKNIGGDFTDYDKIFAKRSAIRMAIYSGKMPQTGSITSEQKKKIICWIDNGAQKN